MLHIDKVLVFDIWGDYAHFKKIETTTSPLTYSFPTGTALAGIIAAVIGLPRDSYYELFSKENVRFAVRILDQIKKIRLNLNLIDTSRGFYLWDIKENPRTPIPFEFVKEPKYRIYFGLRKDKKPYRKLYEKLKSYLCNHRSFYTPYFGISELIANFRFVDEFNVEEPIKSKGDNKIGSIIRMDKARISPEDIEEGKTYIRERIPLYMNKERVVQKYVDVLFEANGKPLKIKEGRFYKIGEDNVIFL